MKRIKLISSLLAVILIYSLGYSQSKVLEDFPLLSQNDENFEDYPNDCGEWAVASILTYWNNNSYDPYTKFNYFLGDNIDPSSQTSRAIIANMAVELQGPLFYVQNPINDAFTDPFTMERGIEKYCNDEEYGNNYNFDVTGFLDMNPTNSGIWDKVKDEIDNGRPVLFLVTGDIMARLAGSEDWNEIRLWHYMPIYGYNENMDGRRTMIGAYLSDWDTEIYLDVESVDNLIEVLPDIWTITPEKFYEKPSCRCYKEGGSYEISGNVTLFITQVEAEIQIDQVEYQMKVGVSDWIHIGYGINDPLEDYNLVYNTSHIASAENVLFRVQLKDKLGGYSDWAYTSNYSIYNVDLDYTIKEVYPSKPSPLEDEIVVISAVVENVGLLEGPVNQSIKLFDNNEEVSEYGYFPSLAPGGERIHTFNWTATRGVHELRVEMNLENDQNLENDSKSMVLFVGTAGNLLVDGEQNPVKSISMKDGGSGIYNLQLQNTGSEDIQINVSKTGTKADWISLIDGTSLSIPEGDFTSYDYTIAIPSITPIGNYTASIVLSYEGGTKTSLVSFDISIVEFGDGKEVIPLYTGSAIIDGSGQSTNSLTHDFENLSFFSLDNDDNTDYPYELVNTRMFSSVTSDYARLNRAIWEVDRLDELAGDAIVELRVIGGDEYETFSSSVNSVEFDILEWIPSDISKVDFELSLGSFSYHSGDVEWYVSASRQYLSFSRSAWATSKDFGSEAETWKNNLDNARLYFTVNDVAVTGELHLFNNGKRVDSKAISSSDDGDRLYFSLTSGEFESSNYFNIKGDADHDTKVTISNIVFEVSYFQGDPNLKCTKSISQGTINVNETATVSMSFENVGSNKAYDPEYNDSPLPTGISLVSGRISGDPGNVDPNETETASYVIKGDIPGSYVFGATEVTYEDGNDDIYSTSFNSVNLNVFGGALLVDAGLEDVVIEDDGQINVNAIVQASISERLLEDVLVTCNIYNQVSGDLVQSFLMAYSQNSQTYQGTSTPISQGLYDIKVSAEKEFYTLGLSSTIVLVVNHPPYMTVDTENIDFEWESGGSANFNISSNVAWSVSSVAAWLSIDPLDGSDDGIISIATNSSNSTAQLRSATVDIIGDHGDVQIITVIQAIENSILINQPPEIDDQVFSIAENSDIGVIVGYIEAVDDGEITYSLKSGSGPFEVNPFSGQISVASGSILDFENISQYELEVEVLDNGIPALSNTALVIINLQNINEAPEIGSVSIVPDNPVSLDNLIVGYTYSDPENQPESGSQIVWYINGTEVTSLNNQNIVPSSYLVQGDSWYCIVVPSDGVNLGNGLQSNIVTIQAENTQYPPIANAGEDIIGYAGVQLILDGSQSLDPDGDLLTYQWSGPSEIILSDATSATPSFTLPVVSTTSYYTFQLAVTDGVNTNQDEVVITNLEISNTMHIYDILEKFVAYSANGVNWTEIDQSYVYLDNVTPGWHEPVQGYGAFRKESQRGMSAINAHPDYYNVQSATTGEIYLEAINSLYFGIGLSEGSSFGNVRFVIQIVNDDEHFTLFDEIVSDDNPPKFYHIDLSTAPVNSGTLRFITDPNGGTAEDWANWFEPRIEIGPFDNNLALGSVISPTNRYKETMDQVPVTISVMNNSQFNGTCNYVINYSYTNQNGAIISGSEPKQNLFSPSESELVELDHLLNRNELDDLTEMKFWLSDHIDQNRFDDTLDFTYSVLDPVLVDEVPVSITIDGIADEIWNTAVNHPLEKTVNSVALPENPADFSADFKMLWDDTYLYFFINVVDNLIVYEEDSWDFWENDCAEVFLDFDNDKRSSYDENDYQIIFYENSTVINGLNKDILEQHLEYARQATNEGYSIEARIPWNAVGLTDPIPGRIIGCDIQCLDNDGAGYESNLNWYDPVDDAWKNPSLFNSIMLSNDIPKPSRINVSTSGSDVTGDGSASHPYLTIQYAIDLAGVGDTVFVHSGTYQENITLKSDLAVVGESNLDTKIVGGYQANVIQLGGNQNMLLSNLNITALSTHYNETYVIHGVSAYNLDNSNVIENLLIHGLNYGIRLQQNAYPRIISNTIIGNNVAGQGIAITGIDAGTLKIENNIIHDFGVCVSFEGTYGLPAEESVVLRYNNVGYYGGMTDPTGSNGNISVDPMFVDASNRDFYLLPGSPCINAGDPSYPLDNDGTVIEIGAIPYLAPVNIHFTPVWYPGNGVDHMNLYALTATIDGIDMEAGDEIGIYDDNVCVGAGILAAVLEEGVYFVSIVTSKDDEGTPAQDGYTPGNTISYRLWDNSEGEEITHAEVSYAHGTGIFSVGGSASFYINGTKTIEGTVSVSEGWNMLSLPVAPADIRMMSIIQPLIDNGSLVKVQDEAGNAIEYIVPIGWVDNIGDWSPSEGYKLRVSGDADLFFSGSPLDDPQLIDFAAGWNIMGYPWTESQAALAAFSDLIDNSFLVKVQDEAGNAIENVFPIGWLDNIHDLETGEGYKVKVSGDCSLALSKPIVAFKSAMITGEASSEAKHFNRSYEGNGHDHMNIYVLEATLNGSGLQEGDEIGLFDGDVCVGAGVISSSNWGVLSIAASMDDPTTTEQDGFLENHAIELRIWCNSNSMEIIPEIIFQSGNKGIYERMGTTVVSLRGEATGIWETDGMGSSSSLGDIYPNPFSEETTIPYTIANGSRVDLAIYDLTGKRVRTLVSQEMKAGGHVVKWDGKDQNNVKLAYGIYVCRLMAGETVVSKMIDLYQ